MGSSRLPRTLAATLAVALLAVPAIGSSQEAPNPGLVGAFSAPFAEPTVAGETTEENCVERDGKKECKPAAGSTTILPGRKVLYWNALEGTENIEGGTSTEFGTVSVNDQSRLLAFTKDGPRWSQPSPVDSGANPGGYSNPLVLALGSDETTNDGALFCSDLNFLADGRVVAFGGTAYYNDPDVPGSGYGVAELEGTTNARVFDPKTGAWSHLPPMAHGRWYPSAVTLADGKQFVASGVTKLLKPVYPGHPEDSGRNVVQTETYDPATNAWAENGATGERSLPLYPRLHLLPNGHVFYNAGGQVFNPFGQAYDEAIWNVAASYDPATKTWKNLGIPGLGTTTAPGFRGSTFSIMLPLRPNPDGAYTQAEFLTAGGILGTTPGTYFAVKDSSITRVDTANGNAIATRPTGPLNDARWYPSAVLLPTGEVLAFNGADKDEVDFPGTGIPARRVELFDPVTETWRPLAASQQARTYHNTAALMADGRVLVGGHAPIPTMYGAHQTLPGGFSPNEGRDPTFEIYSPPYLFRGKRAKVLEAPEKATFGKTIRLELSVKASKVHSVVLMRNPTVTHLVDGDQRAVVLRVLKRRGKVLTVAAPPSGGVAPAGPYLLFVNRRTANGPVPSVAKQLRLR